MQLAHHRASRRNLKILVRFMLVLVLMIAVYAVTFHLLMLREGQDHSWLTGLYWTLTVMSTLGFGDITFHTDLGRMFSLLVLLSGMVFLLILLPFTFIEFFYEPWMKAQQEARTPRRVDDDVRDHVVMTNYDVVTAALIRRLEPHQIEHVVVVPVAEEALRLQDLGAKVAVGDLDDPETYRRVGADRAAMVVATGADVANSNAAFTAREVAPSVPIICTAHAEASVDVLQLAGANHVLRLEQMMGQALARRTLGGDTSANVIGHVEGILVAEASAHGTPLVGKTLLESRLRQDFGVAVAGVWERGHFEPARPTTRIEANTVLVLVGAKESLRAYDEKFHQFSRGDAPVVIIGGGRVGRATARALAEAGLDYRIIEKVPERAQANKRYIVGDASDLDVLKQAGIEATQTVIITTHLDDVNVYLTLYCRKLRPDVQILARATHERNIGTLHRAGADFVLSYASMGASALLNLMRRNRVLMVAEGLDLFRVRVPAALAGKPIAECAIREKTGCSVVAVSDPAGGMKAIPGPGEVLPKDADILLIGTLQAEEEFLELFPDSVTDE